MLNLLLEKMLLEKSFMIDCLKNLKDTEVKFRLNEDEVEKMEKLDTKIMNFFGIKDAKERAIFFVNVEIDTPLQEHFIQYANEKCTYVLASERGNLSGVVGVVWCQANPN